MGRKKRYVKPVRLNWNAEYISDLMSGDGFPITEPSGVSIDGVSKKSLFGASSPLYGTTYEDENAFIERYRCDCGEFKGRQYEGEECPICHTKIRERENNINVTGWIGLDREQIINPYYFNILMSAIGKNTFLEIIIERSRVTTDGQSSSLNNAEGEDITPLSPYSFIGIRGFYEKYEEIMHYFMNKKKNKEHTFYVLLHEKYKVFTHHIPIYSTMLRPQSVTSDTFYFESVDKLINTTFSLSDLLKKSEPFQKENILYRIQSKVNKMWDIALDMINGKEGWIRDQVLGGSLNYTSRCVIRPEPMLHDNEVDLSYKACLELFKYKIIYYLMKLNNTTLSKAYAQWNNAVIFDKSVYEIMNFILREEDPKLLINRNPTLNYYSMLLMRIRRIESDDSLYTMSVPLSILSGLNADFDGDILNIIGLMDPGIIMLFRKFDPVMRMIISRDSGKLNEYFSITKGQLIDLYAFATYEGEEDCNTKELPYKKGKEQKDGFDSIKDVPVIESAAELKDWLKPVYIIEDYMRDHDTYTDFRIRNYNILMGCFTIPACRNYPITFKFRKSDRKTYQLPYRMFIINVILWYPFIELDDPNVLNSQFIFTDPEALPNIEEYINEQIIRTMKHYQVSNERTNYAISEVLYNLRDISRDYSIIMGIDFSIPMFQDMYNNYPDIKDIMEYEFDSGVQPHDAEMKLSELQDKFIAKVKSIPNNHLGLVLRAGTGVKAKQLAEFAIAQGLKPDLSGKTVPKVNSNSTLIKGADKPSALYIEALGARKSLILNKKTMGSAGYFGKTVLMSTRSLVMSKDIVDCGSKHLVEYDVLNKKVLKKLSGKYYKMKNDPEEELKIVNGAKDTKLIGKKIYVRSAVTCALSGNCVCSRCIGETAMSNIDISDGISAFESEEVTKVVNQNILSAKHLLQTISEEIKFNPDFYKFFTIMGGEINPIVDDNKDIPNIEDYAIFIDANDIQKVDEYDEDSLYNTMISNGRFYIRNITDPNTEEIVMKLDDEKEIYISEDASGLLKKYGYIPFVELSDEVKLFEVSVSNNELTKPLHDLMHVLNRQTKDGSNQTIDSISNTLLNLIIEAKIDASVVAIELIVNQLVRSVADPYRRPDFSKDVLEPYVIYTVTKSLERNKSPLIGLAYQNIKRQILSNDFFEVRNEPSYIDPFFDPVVSMKNIIRYHNAANKAGKKKKKLVEK